MDGEQSRPSPRERLVEATADVQERGREAIADHRASRPHIVVVVYGRDSGPPRKVEAFVAQVLGRLRHHDTVELLRICAEEQPELVGRLGVTELPTVLVVETGRVEALPGRRGLAKLVARWLS